MTDDLAEVRALFDPAPGSIYLDTATYGLPPRPTLEAMHQALDAWQAGTADWIADWDQTGETARAAFGGLIGAPSEAVALVPSVSAGVATVAATLRPGDEVLLADDEFISVAYPLLVAQQLQQYDVQVRAVPFDALPQHIRPGTSLVAFSLVQSQSGRAPALAEILDAAQQTGARTLVDATHAIPFYPLADQLARVDYLVCAAYKHLLSPRGVAFLYVHPERWDLVPPIMANWRSSSHPYGNHYGPTLSLAPTAARFDVSLAWFAWHGASISLSLLADWQARGLLQHPVDLARQLAQALGLPEPPTTVLSVPVDDAERVRQQLTEAGIRAAVRAGSVRLSTHVYNTAAEVERAATVLAAATAAPQSVAR